MGRRSRYSPEVRERAVRMVFEHEREYSSQWGAVTSIAAKIGCTAETLRKWVRQAERDQADWRQLEFPATTNRNPRFFRADPDHALTHPKSN